MGMLRSLESGSNYHIQTVCLQNATLSGVKTPNARRQRFEQTRANLLQVGRDLFSAKGFGATGTEEIVQLAGTTRGGLYYHFKDKKDLFRAVFEEVEAGLADTIRQQIEAHSDEGEWAYFGAAIDAYLDCCLDPVVQRIALQDAPSVLGWSEWRDIENRHSRSLLGSGIKLIIARGLIEKQPARPLTHLIGGALTEAAFAISQAADPGRAREEMGVAIKHILAGLRKP
jgi:AcrR family transcriptional regulator